VTPSQHGEQVHLVVAIPGHPATIAGRVDAAHETLTGTFTQNGKSEPLILKPVHSAH
jgi:predicted dienelactone hydrolase